MANLRGVKLSMMASCVDAAVAICSPASTNNNNHWFCGCHYGFLLSLSGHHCALPCHQTSPSNSHPHTSSTKNNAIPLPFLQLHNTSATTIPAQFMQYADANMKSSSSSSSSAARSTETERHCIILKNTPTPGFARCDQRHCKSVVDKKKSVKHGFLLRGIWYLLVHKVRSTYLTVLYNVCFSRLYFLGNGHFYLEDESCQ